MTEQRELTEALYMAEEFICTVQKWMGSDPEEKSDTLDAIRAALTHSTPRDNQ